MDRATAVQTREALELVDAFKKAGIRFVPMPVFDDDDEKKITWLVDKRLKAMEESAP